MDAIDQVLIFFKDVSFALTNVLGAFAQLAFGLYDQTHYHVAAFKLHCGIALDIVWHYLLSIPRNFVTHWEHGRILHAMGMDGVENLKDTGSLVWRPLASEGNLLGSKPAEHVTGLVDNNSGNPAHLSLSAAAMDVVWSALENVPQFTWYDRSVFLDFGCGTGLPMLAAMTKPFQNIVGVELDARCADLARQNIAAFTASKQRQVSIRCHNVTVHNTDMSDFEYSTLACPDSTGDTKPTIVLYMYEPLWTIRKPDAHLIYQRIFRRAQQSACPVLVAYFYCGMYNGDALPALAELGAELLFTGKYDSLNFGTQSDFLLYKLC